MKRDLMDPEEIKAQNIADTDPEETQEWLESLEEVLAREGPQRTQYLLSQLLDLALAFATCAMRQLG